MKQLFSAAPGWGRCNTLKHSLERRVVENQPVFESSLLLRWILGSWDEESPLLQKVGTQLAKLWTWTQIKHAVTTSADTSSSGGSEMQWMSRDEGSDRQSRSLVCSSVMEVEDARMTFIREREIGWCKNLSRGRWMLFFSKTFQIYECSPLDVSVEVKKGGYIKVSQVVS